MSLPVFSILLSLAIASVNFGCSSTLERFVCESNEECDSEQGPGICEADNLCSFSDMDCESGQRYGSAAGIESGKCTGQGIEPDADVATDADVTVTDAGAGDGAVELPTDARDDEVDAASPGTVDANVGTADAAPMTGPITLRTIIDYGGTATAASVTVFANGQFVGTCSATNVAKTCSFNVDSGDTLNITSMGELSFITGSCPSCSDTPCNFVVPSSCDFVTIFAGN